MAISSYSNPIPEIIDGLLRGHQLGLQMQQAARADQEFKTQQAMHNQQMSMQDIMNQHTIQSMGRSVDPATGMVTDTTQLPSMPITPGSTGGTSQSPDLYNLPTRPGPTMTNQAGISAPIAPGSQGAPPDVSNLPIAPGPSIPGQSVTYQRKPDKSRLTAPYKTLSGNTIQSEAYTPEEVQQQAMASKLAEYHAQEQAKLDEQIRGMGPLAEAQGKVQQQQALAQRQNELKLMPGGGIDAPAGIESFGFRKGDKMTYSDVRKVREGLAGVNKPLILKRDETALAENDPFIQTPPAPAPAMGQPTAPPVPGETNINFPFLTGQAGTTPAAIGTPAAPGTPSAPPGMHVLATGGASPPPGIEGFYIEKYAQYKGKTVEQLTKPEVDEAMGQAKAANVNPEIQALTIAAKQQALANAQLANATRQMQLGQLPTQQDAINFANDIQNHYLAPSQLTELRGRGGGSLGIMIEREMKKRDPQFNWQQADADYAYSKNPALQGTIRLMDSALNSLPRLQAAADTLANGKVRSINSLIKLGKSQFNNVDLKRFQTDTALIGDEVAKILQGGGTGSATSDAKLRQAQELFKDTDSPAAIRTALQEIQAIVGYRRQAITRGTYLENAPPPEAGGGSTGGGAPATRPPLGSFERK